MHIEFIKHELVRVHSPVKRVHVLQQQQQFSSIKKQLVSEEGLLII